VVITSMRVRDVLVEHWSALATQLSDIVNQAREVDNQLQAEARTVAERNMTASRELKQYVYGTLYQAVQRAQIIGIAYQRDRCGGVDRHFLRWTATRPQRLLRLDVDEEHGELIWHWEYLGPGQGPNWPWLKQRRSRSVSETTPAYIMCLVRSLADYKCWVHGVPPHGE
jgi:hypothetical protein